MQMPLCCRCHKNVAVVFITKLDEGESSNQGYCLKCARELGMRTLREDGMLKVGSGLTSLSEVLRVTMGDAD